MKLKTYAQALLGLSLSITITNCSSDATDESASDGDGNNDTEQSSDTDQSYTCETNTMRPVELFDIADALKSATAEQGNPANTAVALVPPYLTPFWITPQIGAGRAALELGCPLEFSGASSDSADQAGDQKKIVDSLIERGIKAMAISCKDASLIEPSIEAAVDQGIPIITFDADSVQDSARYLYLGTVNYNAGKSAGEKMVELLGDDGGEVALFLNSPDDANLKARKDGIEAAFEGTSISLADSYSHQGDLDLLRTNIQTSIADHPDLAGMISINGHIGPILGEVLTEEGKQGEIKAVVFDLLDETQTHLENNVIQAVIIQQAYFFGYLGVHIAYSLATIGVDETMSMLEPWLDGDVLDTGVTVLTSENLSIYQDFLTCLGVSAS